MQSSVNDQNNIFEDCKHRDCKQRVRTWSVTNVWRIGVLRCIYLVSTYQMLFSTEFFYKKRKYWICMCIIGYESSTICSFFASFVTSISFSEIHIFQLGVLLCALYDFTKNAWNEISENDRIIHHKMHLYATVAATDFVYKHSMPYNAIVIVHHGQNICIFELNRSHFRRTWAKFTCTNRNIENLTKRIEYILFGCQRRRRQQQRRTTTSTSKRSYNLYLNTKWEL